MVQDVLVCYSEAKSNASTGWVTSGTEEFNKEASFVEGCVVTNLDDLGLKGHIPPEIDILKAVPIDNLWKAQKVHTIIHTLSLRTLLMFAKKP